METDCWRKSSTVLQVIVAVFIISCIRYENTMRLVSVIAGQPDRVRHMEMML